MVSAIAVLAAMSPTAVGASGDVSIEVLSNRADLVSGGDALVEISVDGGDVGALTVELNGNDVTSAFAVRDDGRFLGRVEDLALGPNDLTATLPGGGGAQLTVTNHPTEGPIFSGPHISPWICTTERAGLGAPDAKCNAATKIDFFYMPRSGEGFQPYDPSNPPTDVATVTTDHGETVPYVVRQETGTQNRGLYRVAVLFDPSEAFEPWDRQAGWNGKLFYPFGASCGTVYSQGSAQNVLRDNALSQGFMVATSSLNVLGSNCNTVLSAESVMMLKEHIVDNYGEIRYTFGSGGSGGSIGQNMVANSYPGLLQGITETAVFPDTITTGMEVFDCHLLYQYFTGKSPHLWNPAQQTLVAGHGTSPATCAGWELFFSAVEDPRNGCGVPDEEAYHPEDNPEGCRGRYEDYEINVWGERPEQLWTAPEQAIGRGFAKATYDNIGIQYGLKALQQGLITTEQFVDLNEKIGGFDVDFNLTDDRNVGDPGTPETAYRSGRINDAAQLDKVAIIDTRSLGNVDPLAIHTMHHSFALKQRIENAHGHSDNHVVWRGGSAGDGSFDVMDEWLTAVEADPSGASLPEKIVANRPLEAEDTCFAGPVSFTGGTICDVLWPYYGAPRIAAGSPMTHDVLKCQTKDLDRSDDYGPVPFTDAQWERLEAVFGETGVCDYTKIGQAQDIESQPWLSYAGGPGGVPLGDAPTSVAL